MSCVAHKHALYHMQTAKTKIVQSHHATTFILYIQTPQVLTILLNIQTPQVLTILLNIQTPQVLNILLNIQTPQVLTILLQFEQVHFTNCCWVNKLLMSGKQRKPSSETIVSDLGYSVCSGLSTQILRVNTVPCSL